MGDIDSETFITNKSETLILEPAYSLQPNTITTRPKNEFSD